MSKNSFRKALRHIKSKKIDERLELLSEIPTNSTSGAYVDTPGQFVQDPDVDNPQFSDHPPDLTQDDSATDTTGLFLSDGTILTAIPPGDNSYVLGPMMSMNYSWGNFTQIGYVRQSDRKMVNLARITGTIGNWDGESGFTSYGQLTLEQAQWFKDQSRSTYFAFYPGPPSDGSDDQGRYEGEMVNSRRTYGNRTPDPRYVDSGSNRSGDPSDDHSLAMDNMGGWLAAAAMLGFVFKSVEAFINWFRQQSPEMQKKLRDLVQDKEIAGGLPYTDEDDAFDNDYYKGPPPDLDDDSDFPDLFPELDLAKGKGKRKGGRRGTQVAHHEPKGEVLTESRKRILREIKKPYKLPETPTKFKVSPKVIGSKNKIVGADMMKQQEIQKSFKPKPDNIWGKGEYAANVRASQEKKNTVLEILGAAEHHWTTLTEKSQREKQEKINEMMAAEHDREMEIMYEKYQKNQNKVDKIRSHYQGKPSPEGYPENPPPKTVNGYHPKYGKNYKHDKLDPHSAESMPKTGDQEIDANIDKATDHEKKDRKLKNLIGKVRKG